MSEPASFLHPIELVVNGEPVHASVAPRTLLSDLLRDELGLTGTHVGCGTGACGSCTVIVDDVPARACLVLAVQAEGSRVETIESLGTAQQLHPVQQAFHACHALQCGFCTPGIVMSTVALLRETPQPPAQVLQDMLQGHLCRCTGYRNIVAALDQAVVACAQED